jgi:Fur family transcriptional regulator, zinc uptake regulator
MPHTAAYKHYQPSESPARSPSRSDQTARVLAQSEAMCRANGARLTRIRRNVLEVLYTSHKPLGAYELADLLSPGTRRMAPITVYRALDFLIEQGLAHRLASQNAYIATIHGDGGETCAFLICEECGDVNEATSRDFADTVSGLVSQAGFRPRAKVLEITGRCAHCQGAGRH